MTLVELTHSKKKKKIGPNIFSNDRGGFEFTLFIFIVLECNKVSFVIKSKEETFVKKNIVVPSLKKLIGI